MGTPKGTKPWNAGTSRGWTDKRGYRWVYVTENGKRRARREQRVVMEKHLGRRLEPWELVHHKDGDTANNDIGNLELIEFGTHTVRHHTGGRKSEDARRSMEAFALIREELKHERATKSELLEACKLLVEEVRADLLEAGGCDHSVGICMCETIHRLEQAEAAIAKAEGR